MGDCKYCGKPAGFLRSKHVECDQQFENGKREILVAVSGAAIGAGSIDGLQARINSIACGSYVGDSEKRSLLALAWANAVDRFLDDGLLDEAEERRLTELKECLSLSQEEVDRSGAFTKVIKAAVLRDVLNGIIPQRMSCLGFPQLRLH